MSSNLLINEPPLQVLPSLATEIGLNEAIFLQQLHYWLGHSKNIQEGEKWVYKTAEEWQLENFPFWSISTIRRTIKKLTDSGLIISGEFNKMKTDRTKWYTIHYETLRSLEALSHSEQVEVVNMVNSGAIQSEQVLPERENTTRDSPPDKPGKAIPKRKKRKRKADPFWEVVAEHLSGIPYSEDWNKTQKAFSGHANKLTQQIREIDDTITAEELSTVLAQSEKEREGTPYSKLITPSKIAGRVGALRNGTDRPAESAPAPMPPRHTETLSYEARQELLAEYGGE